MTPAELTLGIYNKVRKGYEKKKFISMNPFLVK